MKKNMPVIKSSVLLGEPQVFFEDDERLQGYFSQYYKKANKARNSPDEAQSETQTESAG
jgi:hypothetical protein